MRNKKYCLYVLIFGLIILIGNAVGIFAEDKEKTNIDTTFVNVVDFQNGRFSPDIELAIEYKDGKLNLFSRSKTIGKIFKEIARKTKIAIKVDKETAQKKVSIFVSDKTLKLGIEAILNSIGQRDLAIGWKEKEHKGKYEISKVEIRKRNKEEMAKIEVEEEKQRKEEFVRREKEYHELFKDMGKKGKLAKMLKDFAEGKKVKGINTYLRQATIKPEEKPLLREALRDPRYKELTGAISMGLTHAVIDKPEESDKDFILKALKERRAQFLIFTLKFIWDERFIPVLIRDVKELHSPTAAEILGARKVKEAIPALEQALLSCENCTEILGALRSITGLSYYVQNGKIKTSTERPKPAPELLKELEEFKKGMEEIDKKRMEKKKLEEKKE